MNQDSALFDSIKIGDLELSSRVVLAPLTRSRAGKDRVPNELMEEYYSQRSSAGLLITEATTISEQANGWNESPGIYTDEMTNGWKRITKAVHKQGSKIFLQLWHCGRASHSSFHGGKPAVAPSAIKMEAEYIHTPKGKEDPETPRALETAEIPGLIDEYRQAAQRAKEAGFDGIEVHSANGYLLDTFMQSKTNHRDDQYGGSIENRFRLLSEVLTAVTEIWSSTHVGVRLSPNGAFNDMGSPDFREQFSYAARELDKFNLAYLHVMDGLGFGFHKLGEPMTLAEFREHYKGNIMGNCGHTKESADEVISKGFADLISFGRPYISNPDLVERFKNNWPLAEQADMSVWYTNLGAKGYTDFPKYEES